MERLSSFNILALVILPIIFMLSTTAPVLGRIPTTNAEETALPKEYKAKLQEGVIDRPNIEITQIRNQKLKRILLQQQQQPNTHIFKAEKKQVRNSTMKEDSDCVEESGNYCNTMFGPFCCSGYSACVELPLIGGTCGW